MRQWTHRAYYTTRRPPHVHIRYIAPLVVLDGLAPIAWKDSPQLFHSHVALLKRLIESFPQILHGGGGQVKVCSSKKPEEGDIFP